MEIIIILKSKFVFYAVFALTFLSGSLYKQLGKNIQQSLGIDEKLTHSEMWEMVKDERENGNLQASVAFFAYGLNTFCVLVMFGLICLMNVDV